MAGNSIGQLFKLTSFGESHGEAIGGVVDGCPSGVSIDIAFVQNELNLRKPDQLKAGSSRSEKDQIKFLSGIFENKTTGAPIAFIIQNTDRKSEDYDHLKNVFRPSHADYTYFKKYIHNDYRGGGRSSARETAVRVAAGAIAKLFLKKFKVTIQAFTSQIGEINLNKTYKKIDTDIIFSSAVRCPDKIISSEMLQLLETLKKNGDTTGGVVSCLIKNCAIGLGEPVFDKLQADFAKAMMSISGAKGFEYGEGFASATMRGSEHNDSFILKNNKIHTLTNHSGGIQGGISNGEDIYFNVAFKPVSSIMQTQKTVNKSNNEVNIEIKGRHDVCIVPKAVSVVEAMASLVLADHYLRNHLI